ncbi:cyclic nucleotide-binding domain-containing protein [Sphingobacterium paucimobilis]|uniref:Cyclic nucleotide-binding domain-containing protein n=1 Tax=Sphingobacterium paucimobilis HER1398 TaxID=1346330 RepID=U2I126_9SPHI|nr:hypothetical protein [Sphingobacterium paucimobilis]ERJ61225.1 hypothetical protein M472_20955 [Sphingobacterium paucimobilis HER1398]
MTHEPDYEKPLYDCLQAIAPLPPDLWLDLLAHIEIKHYSKNRNIAGQLFDMHIVLAGTIVKRRDEKSNENSDVLDFISPRQAIYHIERIDNCYFEADSSSTLALISREQQDTLLNKHPIFNRHLRHFIVEVLKSRTFRSKLVNLQGIEKKTLFKKAYPDAYRDCAIKDKSSFLGLTPTYYSSLDI